MFKVSFSEWVFRGRGVCCKVERIEDPTHPLLKKALYGLKQALEAWYQSPTKYRIQKGYSQEGAYQTLLIK